MPTYEYRCTECGIRTEAFQRMSDSPLTKCPSCQKESLQRVVSGGAGVLYKGEGWYVTDYSKKSSGGKEAPAATPSAAPSATPETSTPKDKPTAKSDTTTNSSPSSTKSET